MGCFFYCFWLFRQAPLFSTVRPLSSFCGSSAALPVSVLSDQISVRGRTLPTPPLRWLTPSFSGSALLWASSIIFLPELFSRPWDGSFSVFPAWSVGEAPFSAFFSSPLNPGCPCQFFSLREPRRRRLLECFSDVTLPLFKSFSNSPKLLGSSSGCWARTQARDLPGRPQALRLSCSRSASPQAVHVWWDSHLRLGHLPFFSSLSNVSAESPSSCKTLPYILLVSRKIKPEPVFGMWGPPRAEPLLIPLTTAPPVPPPLTPLLDRDNYFEFPKLSMNGNAPQITASTLNFPFQLLKTRHSSSSLLHPFLEL